MGGGNGAKAAHKQKLNAAKNEKKGPTSQLKANAAALTIQCDICKQTFQGTSKKPQLELHRSGKHDKQSFESCFPKFVEPA